MRICPLIMCGWNESLSTAAYCSSEVSEVSVVSCSGVVGMNHLLLQLGVAVR